MISKSVTRRTLLKSGTAAAAIGLASPFIISSARAKADHTLTFGHTFGKATEDVMITGLGLFKKKAEEYAGGKLLVDIHEAGSLGGQTVLPNKVLTGAIQGCPAKPQGCQPRWPQGLSQGRRGRRDRVAPQPASRRAPDFLREGARSGM